MNKPHLNDKTRKVPVLIYVFPEVKKDLDIEARVRGLSTLEYIRQIINARQR